VSVPPQSPAEPPLPCVAPPPAAAVRWRWLFATLAIVVAFLALVPAPPPRLSSGWDKLNHMAAFAALAWVACRGWAARPTATACALVGVLALGAAIEAMQMLVASRSAELGDLLADAIGTSFGAAAALIVMPALHRLRTRLAVPWQQSCAAMQRVADAHREPRED